MALTRSVWHCSLGVAPLVRRRGDKKGDTDVHQSALGRLLQKGNRKMRQGFAPVLKRYAMMILHGKRHKLVITNPWQVNDVSTAELNAKTLQRLPGDNWRVTSYSGLQQRGHGIAQI